MPKAKKTTPKKGLSTTPPPKKAPARPEEVSDLKHRFQGHWKHPAHRQRTPAPSGMMEDDTAEPEPGVDGPLVSDVASPPTNAAKDLYNLMHRSWEQVSRHIQRTFSESNEDSALADFLQRRARDCLGAQSQCPADSSPSIWQVSIAVQEAGGHELSFPIFLLPQTLSESLIHPARRHLPLSMSPGSDGRELSSLAAGQDVLQFRHAFVVHACDLLVRPFGVVGKRVEYDLSRLQLKYIIRACDVNAQSVFSFLAALSRAEKGGKSVIKAGSEAPSHSRDEFKSRVQGQSDAGSSTGRKRLSATTIRDAMCPITLGTSELVSTHLMHLRLGQPIYSWIMEGFIEENRRSQRYDLNAWSNIEFWDINAQTNLMQVDPKLNLSQSWFFLPAVKEPSASLLPRNSLLTTSFWRTDEPADLRNFYVFVQLRDVALSANAQEFDIDWTQLYYKNFTGIRPVFVMGSSSRDSEGGGRKRRKTAQSPTCKAVDNDQFLAGLGTASSASAAVTAINLDEVLPALKAEPGPRQSRPTSPQSYWPDDPCYPPPVAWDAMTASRVMQYYRSLAVSCFSCIGDDELEVLINALPPRARSQTQHVNHGNAQPELGGGNGTTDSHYGDAGQDQPLARPAPRNPFANDGHYAQGERSSTPAGDSSVGTVFIMSVMLLASQYAAHDNDDAADILLTSSFGCSSESQRETVDVSDHEDYVLRPSQEQEWAEAQDLSYA